MKEKTIISRNKIRTNILIIGAGSIITQLLYFRELYSVVHGNELIFGIILSLWLMLSGVGTFIGKVIKIRNTFDLLKILHFLLAILPIISVLGIRYGKAFFFEPGIMLNIAEITLFSLIWTAPYCIIAGISLVQYSRVYPKDISVGSVYLLDLIGAGVGALVFYFLFLKIYDSFDSLNLILLLNTFSAFLLIRSKKQSRIILLTGIFIIVGFQIIIINFEQRSMNELYPKQEIEEIEDTPYGRLVITKTEDQYNFFEDGTLLFSTNSVIANEETVHFSLSQMDKINKVLLISGGLSGQIVEILKYNPKMIDYTEVNADILKYGHLTHAALNRERVSVHPEDGRKFLTGSETKYDAIILNVPQPSNAQLNRYYTLEFFKIAKNKLTDNGILTVHLPATANYLSSEEGIAQSVIYNTLNQIFENIIIFPGTKNYFIASGKELTYKIIPKLLNKGIENEYVNQYYYDQMSVESRGEYIKENLVDSTAINRDFKPFAYFTQINYWLSFFQKYDIWVLAIFLFPLILFIFRANPVSIGLFTGGFAASSVQFILILAFQVIYGYAYEFIAIIFSVFMFGLAFGAIIIRKINKDPHILYRNILLILTAYVLALPLVLRQISHLQENILVIPVFLLMILIISLLGGMQFPVAGFLIKEKYSEQARSIASDTFSADYFGGAVGAIITGVFLVPLLSIDNTCYVIAGLSLAAYLLIVLKK